MKSYTQGLNEIPLGYAGKKALLDNATGTETTMFRGIFGTLLWLEKGVILPATYAGSKLQQQIATCRLYT